MIKKLKLHFKMKMLTKQMKYELLSHLYLFISKKEEYFNVIHELATLPPDVLKDKLLSLLENDNNKDYVE
ncbi:hypothetical protein [Lachnoclostridium sp.]|uniref:hypothetical protein n=1 Tax=Lachnoclostridium sp. TaxID=2028282 RepID=UPI00289E6B08|nr:hypothetical protein [Lachnoclostridium sp.]